jgi:hypothetical protein
MMIKSRIIIWAGHQSWDWRDEKCVKYFVGNLRERDHLKD